MKEITAESSAGVRPCSPALPDYVSQVLDSQTFERAPALRSLLTYLWGHRHESLSEYAIATEALGRSHSFDARTDATVRVQVSRLRQRLEKYYEKENTSTRQRLVIPLGSHQVMLEQQELPLVALSFPELPPVLQPVQQRRSRSTFLLIGLLVFCCLVEGSYLLHLRSELSHAKEASAPSAPRFWQNFFRNGHVTRLALPTPIFFSFKRNSSSGINAIMLRDTELNDFSAADNSEPIRMMRKALGPPVLAENYTVTSDTFASVRLARYLDRFGLQTNVSSSADNLLEALDRENLIALGTWGTLEPLKTYLDTMSFELGPHETSVRIRRPEPGEPSVINAVPESPERGIWPGVIGFLPSHSNGSHLLILASRHTAALISFLTSSEGLDQLEKLWTQKGSPEYFEVIVSAELSGRGVVRSWPVALHPYLTAR